jgi:hypothetical protein
VDSTLSAAVRLGVGSREIKVNLFGPGRCDGYSVFNVLILTGCEAL